MVTTTTKTLNYSITKGNQTNSVNATITSTPGFNSNYLGKVPGILKLLELVLAIVATALVASVRDPIQRLAIQNPDTKMVDPAYGLSFPREIVMAGEIYFLCAHTAVLTVLVIVLVAYLFHTTSAMIIPKATTLENVMNIILAVMLLAAGITEIVMAVTWQYNEVADPNQPGYNRLIMEPKHLGIRIAGGAIAILNGLLFIGSFVMSRKELAGPKTL